MEFSPRLGRLRLTAIDVITNGRRRWVYEAGGKVSLVILAQREGKYLAVVVGPPTEKERISLPLTVAA